MNNKTKDEMELEMEKLKQQIAILIQDRKLSIGEIHQRMIPLHKKFMKLKTICNMRA